MLHAHLRAVVRSFSSAGTGSKLKQLSTSESTTIRRWLAQLNQSSDYLQDKHRDCYELTYSRSSGPGGQNVNKVNTKATLRFDLAKAQAWIPSPVLENLRQTPFYADVSNALVLSSMRHRTQTGNAQDCLDKLKSTINEAAAKDLQGETSDAQRKRVAGLVRKDKARTKQTKQRSSQKKQGRSKNAWL